MTDKPSFVDGFDLGTATCADALDAMADDAESKAKDTSGLGNATGAFAQRARTFREAAVACRRTRLPGPDARAVASGLAAMEAVLDEHGTNLLDMRAPRRATRGEDRAAVASAIASGMFGAVLKSERGMSYEPGPDPRLKAAERALVRALDGNEFTSAAGLIWTFDDARLGTRELAVAALEAYDLALAPPQDRTPGT